MEGKSILKTIAGHIPGFIAVFLATTAALVVYGKFIKSKVEAEPEAPVAPVAPVQPRKKVAADGSDE